MLLIVKFMRAPTEPRKFDRVIAGVNETREVEEHDQSFMGELTEIRDFCTENVYTPDDLTEEELWELYNHLEKLEKMYIYVVDECLTIPAIDETVTCLSTMLMNTSNDRLKEYILHALVLGIDSISDMSMLISPDFLAHLDDYRMWKGNEDIGKDAMYILSRMALCKTSFEANNNFQFWWDIVCSGSDVGSAPATWEFRAYLLDGITHALPCMPLPDDAYERIGELLISCLFNNRDEPAFFQQTTSAILGYLDQAIGRENGLILEDVRKAFDEHVPSILGLLDGRVDKGLVNIICTMISESIWEDSDGTTLGIVEEMMRHAVCDCENPNEEIVAQCLRIGSRVMENTAWGVFSEGAISAAQHAVANCSVHLKELSIEFLSAYYERMPISGELKPDFADIILDLVQIPAMEVIESVLMLFYTVIRDGDGFVQWMMEMCDDWELVDGMLDEILRQSENDPDERRENISDLIANIRRKVEEEQPLPAARKYAPDDDKSRYFE